MVHTDLAEHLGIPKETIHRFVQVLEDTMVAFRIRAFVPRLATSRRVLQRERVLLFDVRVRNALLGLHRRRLSPDQIGSVFEQWVILQVTYLDHALCKGWRFSSYRREGGAEVDLVLVGGESVDFSRRLTGGEWSFDARTAGGWNCVRPAWHTTSVAGRAPSHTAPRG
jgi:predicted AAA+ superfamily ATPase